MLGELIADGRTSRVYRFGSDGAVKVLKSSTPQDWAEAEATFTDSIHRLGVPTPDVRSVIDVDGHAAVVFERIDGPTMWQRMLERPADVTALTRELADIQRVIHRAGVPDGVAGLVERVRLKLEVAPGLRIDEVVEATELLDGLPVGAALLHGDLHPGNVLLGPTGPIVIDWFDATVGHPTADVARTMLLVQPNGATDLRHLPSASTDTVARIHRKYVERVGELDPPHPTDLADWCRLQSACRLAERTDVRTRGLLAGWRSQSQAGATTE